MWFRAAGTEPLYISGFVCMRVLITSSGVVYPWLTAAEIPPAAK